MNRESIIIIICIGVVALFYLFQVDNTPKKEVGLAKQPVVQSTNNIIKKVLHPLIQSSKWMDMLNMKMLKNGEKKIKLMKL